MVGERGGGLGWENVCTRRKIQHASEIEPDTPDSASRVVIGMVTASAMSDSVGPARFKEIPGINTKTSKRYARTRSAETRGGDLLN